MSGESHKLKRSQASLTGGIIVGFGVFILTMLIARELDSSVSISWLLSILLAFGFGSWIRVADL